MIANRFPLMSCFVLEPLATRSSYSHSRALSVVNAQLGAGVHSEIELAQVAVKVFVIHVLIHTDQTAFEDREEVLKRIGVNVTTRPFVLGVIDRLMLVGLADIHSRSVRDQTAAVVKVLSQGAAHVLMVEVHGADIAAALYKAKNLGRRLGIQCRTASLASLGRLCEVGFIGFDRLASAANRASISARGHRQPNPMTDEPCRFHAAAQHALELARADAFLAGAHQVDRLQPDGHLDMAVLENGADLDRELLAAFLAVTQAGARRFAVELMDAGRIAVTAVRADRAGRPQPSLDIGVGGFFVFELGGVEIRVHGFGSGMAKSCAPNRDLSSVTSPAYWR